MCRATACGVGRRRRHVVVGAGQQQDGVRSVTPTEARGTVDAPRTAGAGHGRAQLLVRLEHVEQAFLLRFEVGDAPRVRARNLVLLRAVLLRP